MKKAKNYHQNKDLTIEKKQQVKEELFIENVPKV